MGRVCWIATGGTISSVRNEETGRAVAALTGTSLLRSVPQLHDMGEVEVHDLGTFPGFSISVPQMLAVARAVNEAQQNSDVEGILVTHGTATLAETAYLTDILLQGDKPVVFTGAMFTADMLSPDGPRNIFNGVRVALDPQARGLGVLVVLNGEIHTARDATKVHTASPAAFVSPGLGPIGYVDEDRVVLYRAAWPSPRIQVERLEEDVDVITCVAGMSDKLMRFVMSTRPRGLVIEGFPGRGAVPPSFIPHIRAGIEQGTIVVLTTRAPIGRVLPKYWGGSGGKDLEDLGVIFAPQLSAPKARLLLMAALAAGSDREAIRDLFAQVAR